MLRNFQREAETIRRHEPVCVLQIDDRRKGKYMSGLLNDSARTGWFLVMNFPGFALAVLEEVVKEYDHLLSTPNLVT
ncbi:MAG TPA: hypothetical protein VEI52_27040 [Terriglobales bacterium]|nr:hypothetical protein [Terriglobales bacterium]